MPGTDNFRKNAAMAALTLVLLLARSPAQADPDFSKLQSTPQSKNSLFPSLGDRFKETAEGGWFKIHPVLSAQEIAKLAQKSTAFLTTKVGQGTGFFVAPGILATNCHMIVGGITDSDRASMRTSEDFGKIEYRINKVLAADKEHDVALLEIADAKNVPPLLLASHSEPQVGDEIYIYGNPQGFEGTFAEGRISAFRMKAQLEMENGPIPSLTKGDCIQYTVPTSPGSSGSAVLNNRGEVIGIHCAGPTVPSGATGKNAKYELMNFAVGVRYIKDLLTQIGH